MTAVVPRRTRLQTVFSLVSGPAFWFLHFALIYSIAEFGCRANYTNLSVISPSAMRVLITLSTVIGLAGVLLGGWLAYQSLHKLPADDTRDDDVQMRVRFTGTTALMLNVLFLFVIVVTTVPTYILPVCDLAAG